MKFTELNLSEQMLAGLSDVQFDEPTPVQEKAIPLVLEGKDLIATAQTGTGKTGAFVIPIMDRILKGEQDGTKALILSPTRELAQQIDEQIFAIGYHTGISSATVIGGSDFSVQAKALKAGVDIIVATPGRLMDQKKVVDIDFSDIEYFILDEADRMLDMGFLPDIKKIISWLPEKRQTLLFSATMPKEIERLASAMMNDPVSVEIARAQAPTQVEQRAYMVKSNQKIPLIKSIFKDIKWDSCIIFTSTKKGTDELQRLLKKEGIQAASIHGDRSQDERNKALNAFKSGKFPVIVATNVLARGIDIKDVSMIVNYDVPNNTDDYIHRIGRTGRYDKSGIAVTFVTRRDAKLFSDIENIKGNSIVTVSLPDNYGENSPFSWNDTEIGGGGEPSKRPAGRTPKGSGSSNKRTKKREPAKQERSGASKNKPSEKKESKKDSNQRPADKEESGKSEKRQEKKETAQKRPSESNESRSENQKKGKTENRDKGKEEQRSPKSEKQKEENFEQLTGTLPVVEKAVERNRRSRKPSKGIWGIIKSFIPKRK
ncbi:MAG: DEAD/DEAH box helicase [Balneolaceae bacterium]